MTTGVVGHRPRVAVYAPQGELRWPKARPREPEARAFEASGFPPVIVGVWAGRKPLGTGRAEGHSLGGGTQGKLDWGGKYREMGLTTKELNCSYYLDLNWF